MAQNANWQAAWFSIKWRRVRTPSVSPDYGGRGVNGYMLDCESGVAGSIPVDHPRIRSRRSVLWNLPKNAMIGITQIYACIFIYYELYNASVAQYLGRALCWSHRCRQFEPVRRHQYNIGNVATTRIQSKVHHLRSSPCNSQCLEKRWTDGWRLWTFAQRDIWYIVTAPSSSWPRTPPFHGDDTGSNPVGVTKSRSLCNKF